MVHWLSDVYWTQNKYLLKMASLSLIGSDTLLANFECRWATVGPFLVDIFCTICICVVLGLLVTTAGMESSFSHAGEEDTC